MIDRLVPINVPTEVAVRTTELRLKCIECDAEIPTPNDVLPGEVLSCPDCGQEYEVSISEGKVKLKPAEKLKEDWGE